MYQKKLVHALLRRLIDAINVTRQEAFVDVYSAGYIRYIKPGKSMEYIRDGVVSKFIPVVLRRYYIM